MQYVYGYSHLMHVVTPPADFPYRIEGLADEYREPPHRTLIPAHSIQYIGRRTIHKNEVIKDEDYYEPLRELFVACAGQPYLQIETEFGTFVAKEVIFRETSSGATFTPNGLLDY